MTNLSNVTKSVFTPMMLALTPGVKALADQLGRLSTWFEAHPKMGMDVAIGAFALVGGAAVLASRNLWGLNLAIQAIGKSGATSAVGVGATAAETAAVGAAVTRTGIIAGLAAMSRGFWRLAGPIGWYVATLQAISTAHDWASSQWPWIDDRFQGRMGDPTAWKNFGDYPLQPLKSFRPGTSPAPPTGIFGTGKGKFGVPLIDSGGKSFGVLLPVDAVNHDLNLFSGDRHRAVPTKREQRVTVNIHIDRPEFVLPKGSTREMALAFLKDIERSTRTALRKTGDSGASHAGFSRLELGPAFLTG
jgi:hypothetical protein